MAGDVVGAMGAGWPTSDGVLVLALLAAVVVLWRSGFIARLMRLIEQTMLGNWQLAVLGAAAIALSLASGYTTFDGLRNFTSAPLLSVLVSFGIQGVLLIVSWLIGESFAAGMGKSAARAGPSGAASTREVLVGVGLGVILVGVAFFWALSRHDAVSLASGAAGLRLRADWQRVTDVFLLFAAGLACVGLAALAMRRGSDVVQAYVQTARLVARNAMLWVMLLACMGASVFFSFDSHFSAIFPAEQRARAAEIRTLGQIAAVVADIGARADKVQAAEIALLLESDAWKAYDARLAALAEAARSAQAQIAAVLLAKLEEKQRGVNEQQERIAGAERSQSALLRKRDELEAELHRLESTIGALEAELAKAQAAHDETKRAIAAKEIEAATEDGGVEGTLKKGKGPIWRQRKAEVEELERKLKLADEPRLADVQRRRDTASARIVGLKREIATIVAEAAKYKGVISAAEARIKAAQEGEADAGGQRIDPERLLEAFERARADFRHRPDAAALAAVETQCRGLLAAFSGAATASSRLKGVDCDPSTVTEAAASVFTLNAGRQAFAGACAGGARLPQAASTDALLAFGRKCLQDSGLASKDSGDLVARFQAIEMNRDDKAHRFVVTWNAVLDGNRLAYLALVLAIGVDSLVFMAGLFGAAAARSPLSDMPGAGARSAEQLEAIVRNALGAARAETAELVLAALRPAPGDDRRSTVDLSGLDGATADRIRKVLVAGRSIGAVERAAGPDGAPDAAELYLVRPELIELLASVAAAGTPGRERSERGRLVDLIGAALDPDRPGNAAIVLRYAEPVTPRRGFVARIDPGAVAKDKDRRLLHGVLAAGMSAGAVMRRGTDDLWRGVLGRPGSSGATYLIGAELFEVLLYYRASPPRAQAPDRRVRPVPLDAAGEYASYQAVHAPALAAQRLLADGRAGDGPAAERDEDELRRQLREALLRDVASEARSALASTDRPLDAQRAPGAALERLERDAARALQRAARALARDQAGDARALELVGEAARELATGLPGLLRALLDDLIAEAEGSDDGALLNRLCRLRSEMGAIE